LQGPGGRLLPAIEAAFPGSTNVGGIDRAALGAQVFGDDAAMKRLEAIVHPAVAEERAMFDAHHRDAALIVEDVPLLFETGGERRVDKVAVVSAPADVQRARVLARPDMNEAKFVQILARQLPDAEKRQRADFVIDTGVSLEETRDQVRALISCLLAPEGR
jgi:dephospho-CoA kinase